jgi:hypothetical protein
VKKLLHIRFERLDASEDVRDGAKGAPISGDFEGGGEREKATKNVGKYYLRCFVIVKYYTESFLLDYLLVASPLSL